MGYSRIFEKKAKVGSNMKIIKVKKRDGRLVNFNPKKIEKAILKSFIATGEGDGKIAKKLTKKVINLLQKRATTNVSSVEEIQDIVEEVLILEGYSKPARAYILYRDQHRRIREAQSAVEEAVGMVDKYLQEIDWEVHENSNMNYSLQGLNNYVTSHIIKRYWLNKIYPPEIRRANEEGDFHIHDLQVLGPYCVGWDLYDLLRRGFGGVTGKVESAPPKHLSSALGQIVNFFYTLQGEAAGAIALSSFDTLIAPFIYYDQLSYPEVKQRMQEFLFNCNVPTRVGFQTPFENLTLDLKVPEYYKSQPVIIGGEPQEKTYGEFQDQMDMINRAFAEIMMEGDAKGRPFTFPIPTYNITKDFDWDNPVYEPIWKMTAKYGIPYFSNFINSDMKPEDVRSMCPLAREEKVLIKSKRRRGLEYSSIGYIYEGNAKENEYEIYSDGRFVKGRFNKFPNQKMIKVTLQNGHEIKMSEEHLNYVMENPDSEIKELKGRELKRGMYLPYSLNAYSGEGGNKDLGYFVGAYAGDGSFDGETTVIFSLENKRKKNVVKKLKDIAKRYFGAHCTTKEYPDTQLFTLKVHSRAAVGLCKDFVEGKKRDKYYKAKIFGTSIDFRKGVLEGHYATDGGNRIYTSSKKMVETLNMLAASLGTTTSVYKDDREGRLGKEPNYVVRIYKFDKDRYKDIWFKHQNKVWIQIKSIERIGNNDAYCFEVKNGEPMFTVGTTGILTHNCRLRLDNRQLYKRGGGLFGSNPLTGSIGVVTINMPRIGYLAKTKKEFLERLEKLMDLAKESLKIKRKTLERFTEKGLYPYSKHYLDNIKKMRGSYWANHFSTIGLVGMNEALLNFKQIRTHIGTKSGQEFAIRVLDFMREKMIEYQKETGDLFNLEATPAEGTSYRLAKIDKEKYPDIITAGKEKPYYTNSSQLPVDLTDDLFEALRLQDNLQTKYTGGCIEKGNKVLTNKGLLNIEYIVKNFERLKPIKVLSYNPEKEISEWDEIVEAVSINVEKHNKIRVKGERNLDIVTSDWHPFFVLERIKPNPACPICGEKVKNIKAFATHIRWNPTCQEKYKIFPKYRVIEKRADKLKVGDYILQNSYNLYPEKETELNNDLMWLIGFFIGDGCISEYIDNRGGNNLKKYKIRFHSSSESALKKVSKILLRYFQAKVKVIQNDKRSKLLKEVSTSKKEILEFFFKYGFKTGKKVYNINIPQKIKENLNKNNVFSLLSGLIDSDGHIDKRDGSLEYYTVSPQLADDILEICSRAGIMISKSLKLTKRRNEVNIYRLRIPQYELTKIRDNLNNIVNLQNIKKSLSNRKKRYFPIVRVKEVSKVNVKDNQFYDLMTKKNHNYLAGKNSLVFIHNTVFHAFLGEQVSDPNQVKKLIKKIFERFHIPYFTFTPTFSICPVHGYIPGEHFTCPKCVVKQPCEVYSRVVGYLRPVQHWNEGKREEFKERKEFKI